MNREARHERRMGWTSLAGSAVAGLGSIGAAVTTCVVYASEQFNRVQPAFVNSQPELFDLFTGKTGVGAATTVGLIVLSGELALTAQKFFVLSEAEDLKD